MNHWGGCGTWEQVTGKVDMWSLYIGLGRPPAPRPSTLGRLFGAIELVTKKQTAIDPSEVERKQNINVLVLLYQRLFKTLHLLKLNMKNKNRDLKHIHVANDSWCSARRQSPTRKKNRGSQVHQRHQLHTFSATKGSRTY